MYLCTPFLEGVHFFWIEVTLKYILCQAVKKEKDIKWLRTSVKNVLEKIVTRRRSNIFLYLRRKGGSLISFSELSLFHPVNF
jgi:hypothetical protein